MREKIIAVLGKIFDPEIPMDIYSLGLIYDVKVNAAGEASHQYDPHRARIAL